MSNDNLIKNVPSSKAKKISSPLEITSRAFHVALGLVFTNCFASVIILLIVKRLDGVGASIFDVIFDCLCILFLLLPDRHFAKLVTLTRAYAGGILALIVFFLVHGRNTMIIPTVIALSYCGCLIVLLQGKTRVWKIYIAIGAFFLFAFVPYAFTIYTYLMK